MAIGSMNRGGVTTGYDKVVVPTSCRGTWIVTNDDLEQTVPATPLNPATITSQYCHWVKVPSGAGKVIPRAKYTKSATVTTDPVIRIYGAFPGPSTVFKGNGEFINDDGSFTDDGTIEFMRLDLAATAGTGITLDLVTSGASMMFDAHATPKAYSDPASITPIDLLGAWYVIACPVTASATDTGVVVCELLFMN